MQPDDFALDDVQRQLDEWFPQGVNVTVVEDDDPGNVDEIQFICPGFVVVAAQDEAFKVVFGNPGLAKQYEYWVEYVEDGPVGDVVQKYFHLRSGGSLLCTSHVGPDAVVFVQRFRRDNPFLFDRKRLMA